MLGSCEVEGIDVGFVGIVVVDGVLFVVMGEVIVVVVGIVDE